MVKKVAQKAKGILNPKLGEQKFHLARYEPSPELRCFVEHYWTVKWDLRGQEPYTSETLPHPSVHLTIEPTGDHVVGVVTRKFSRQLEGQGWVFGIKFKPGGFYPFVKSPVTVYTDKVLPISELFGEAGVRYATAIREASSQERCDEVRVAHAEAFLRSLSPAHDDHVELVNHIVEIIATQRAITKVDHITKACQINKRALQRLFSQYVGVSPKWVIQRCRLHEATEAAADGEDIDWARLAVDLGYYDQAHLIKDFKTMVGMTPLEYARRAATSDGHERALVQQRG